MRRWAYGLSWIVFFGFLPSLFSNTSSSYSLNAGLRSFPLGFSVGGDLKWTQYLWGQNQNVSILNSAEEKASAQPVLFGLIQESVFIGSHGLVGVNIDIFPISFLKLTAGKSYVSKYYEVRTLNCDRFECKGNLVRDYYKAALALAYGPFIFAPQYNQIEMTSRNRMLPFVSEEDYLVGAIGADTAITRQALLAYQYTDSIVGLLIRSTEVLKFKNKALSQYFVWQLPLKNIMDLSTNSTWQSFGDSSKIKLNLGAGLFSSDWADPGFSILMGIKWGGGDDPALF